MAIALDQLRTFVAVAEAGGLTPAAETLHLSLPAISRRLTALEEELGVALLTRSTRRVALTQTGREFLPRARRLLDELEESLLGIREGEIGNLAFHLRGGGRSEKHQQHQQHVDHRGDLKFRLLLPSRGVDAEFFSVAGHGRDDCA